VRNTFPVRHDASAKLVLSTEMGSVRVDEGAPVRPEWPDHARSQPAPKAEPAAAASAAKPARADPELDRILKMVEAGELSAQDADELLRAMGRD
jgi:hypothetical protein